MSSHASLVDGGNTAVVAQADLPRLIEALRAAILTQYQPWGNVTLTAQQVLDTAYVTGSKQGRKRSAVPVILTPLQEVNALLSVLADEVDGEAYAGWECMEYKPYGMKPAGPTQYYFWVDPEYCGTDAHEFDKFYEVIAPFIQHGGHMDWEDEHGGRWRVAFASGGYSVKEATISYS